MTRTLAMVIVIVAACGTAAPGATQTAAPTSTPTAAISAAPSTPVALASLPAGVEAGGTTWGASADMPNAQEGDRFLFQCPPDGSEYAIWGSGTYTSDSSVCTAAVHSGLIDFVGGGSVVIEIRPGQVSYTGSEHNGVTSGDYASWGTSFAFAGVLTPPPGTATASPAPSGALGPDYGADTEIFRDDFSDTSGGWSLHSYAPGWGVLYDPSEALKVELASSGAAFSTSGPVEGGSWDVVRVEGTFVAEAAATEGYFGLLCGGTEELVGALVSNTGEWAFLRQVGSATGVLERGEAELGVESGTPVQLTLECAGTATGSLRLQLSLGPTIVESFYGPEGPASFDRLGAFAEAIGDTFSVLLDDVVAFGGLAANLPPLETPGASAEFSALLAHVPEVMRQDCNETTSFDAGLIVATQCLPDAIDGYVTYKQFDTVDNQRAAFLDDVDFFGEGADGADCQVGPAEQIYSVDGAPVGRLMCNNHLDGPIAIWTHEGLTISGFIQAYSGTFQDLYATWLTAGPQ